MIEALGRLPVRATKRRDTASGGTGRIAIQASSSGGPQASIQIRAQVLRGRQASAGSSGVLGFVMPEEPPPDDTRPDARWRETEVERAIAAAERAGLRAYRVEIAPDGTIAIVVGNPPDPPEE